MLMEVREGSSHGGENVELVGVESGGRKHGTSVGRENVEVVGVESGGRKRGASGRIDGENGELVGVESSGRKRGVSGGRNGVKRKGEDEEGPNGVRKRSKKELPLSSLSSSGRRSKKSGGAECESGESGKVGRSGNDDISLKLIGDVSIPKRPRDLVRRKKVEVDAVSKLGGGGVSGEGEGKWNGDGEGVLAPNGNGNGKLAVKGESEGGSSNGAVLKVNGTKKCVDHGENRTSGSDLHGCLKRENSQSSVHNGDTVIKKARRNRNKGKESRTASGGVASRVKQTLDESRRICDESQEDEENLEANAARMLSSRFDPSCTVFLSGANGSRLPSANGLSALTSSGKDFATAHPNSRDDSDIASSDAEIRVLRPRDQEKGKGISRKRRNYYAVISRDLDNYWVVNRRIKVFWPLDQSWYFGHVVDYDPVKKLHHVRYDDREEEWIDLQNERFKLLLLPSEVPEKVGKKRSTEHDKHPREEDMTETGNTQGNGSSYMESEPIISWLARSSHQKSPPSGIRKKQRTLQETSKLQSSFVDEENVEPRGSVEVGSSGQGVDKSACVLALPQDAFLSGDSTGSRKSSTQKIFSNNSSSPIVYFRRRFQKREEQPSDIRCKDLCHLLKESPVCGSSPEFIDTVDLGADMLHKMVSCDKSANLLSPNDVIWDIDCSGCLKLIIPVTSLKVFRFALSFPCPFVSNNLIGWQSYMFMLRHGTVIAVWPMVHLEILFVDNIVGLRFLLFEGCLKQAVSFIFLVLFVFRSYQKEYHVGQQLPVTSVRFQLSGFGDHDQQLVFAFYNFSEIANVKWSYLDRKLKKHCLLTKQLPPSECTYDNIKALRNGCQLPATCVSSHSTSVTSFRKKFRQQRMSMSYGHAAYVKLSGITCDSDGKFPSFALSFAAAPTFFLGLHLKLLMERSISPSSFGKHNPLSLMDHSENKSGLGDFDKFVAEDSFTGSPRTSRDDSGVLSSCRLEMDSCPVLDLESNGLSADLGDGVPANSSHSCVNLPEIEGGTSHNEDLPLTQSELYLSSVEALDANKLSPVDTDIRSGAMTDLTIEIPLSVSGDPDASMQTKQDSSGSILDINDEIMHSSTPTPQSTSHRSRFGPSSPSVSAALSPAWTDKKQDFLCNGFGNGPKKPRTQVSYSLLYGGQDNSSKNKFHHSKGFSHRRIRKASEKKTSEAFGSLQRNMEFLSCDVNVLVTVGDRGWRECGARVVLELVDHNEWRLSVKISGDTKFSYKAHQFLQPGTTNRYTHAMMWKGGKDWILEFTDRSQWTTFKELHEECYNRNLRAASVKNIPIPGVHLVEETDDNMLEVPFIRPSSQYYMQLETDIDIAMDPSRVLYDMDSDDERWVTKRRASDFNVKGYGDVSDEMFEKIMDAFEKFAFAKQCDHFSLDELEEAMAGLGSLDAIIIIYEHWREKRQSKGMPLIRHLQPPLWETYQQQVREWEQAITKSNARGFAEKSLAIEKPPMFAFCLKPRGLEVPNKGSKQRSQKKLPVGALINGVHGDSEAFHSIGGRRLNGFAMGDDRVVYAAYNQGTLESSPVLQGSTRVFSPRDAGGGAYFSLSSDGFERNHFPKHYRNKSKKSSFIPPLNDQQAFSSYSPRTMGKRSSAHPWNFNSSEWPSQMHYLPDRFQRHSFEQLDPSELDEFRLRDAASAARHAVTIAKMKRENAQRMLCRADLAMHKAVAAIMTADAVKASYEEPKNDV